MFRLALPLNVWSRDGAMLTVPAELLLRSGHLRRSLRFSLLSVSHDAGLQQQRASHGAPYCRVLRRCLSLPPGPHRLRHATNYGFCITAT